MNSTRNQIPADELPTRPRFGRKEGAGRSLAVGSLAVRSRVVGLLAVGLLVLAWTASLVPAAAAGIGEASPAAAADETVPEPTQLSVLDAVVLGAVEGVTEFLPISSTGHLFFTERILSIGNNSIYLDTESRTMIATGHPQDALKNGHPKVRHFLTRGGEAPPPRPNLPAQTP